MVGPSVTCAHHPDRPAVARLGQTGLCGDCRDWLLDTWDFAYKDSIRDLA